MDLLNMKYRIQSIIDKEILRCFDIGLTLTGIIDELEKKSNRMMQNIDRDKMDLRPIFPALYNGANVFDLPGVSTKLKYYYTYIKHTQKRIDDMKWIIINKKKFPLLSNSQIFKLLELRDKLSKENSLPF